MSNTTLFWILGICAAVILAIKVLQWTGILPEPKDPGGGQ